VQRRHAEGAGDLRGAIEPHAGDGEVARVEHEPVGAGVVVEGQRGAAAQAALVEVDGEVERQVRGRDFGRIREREDVRGGLRQRRRDGVRDGALANGLRFEHEEEGEREEQGPVAHDAMIKSRR
jgi:hypothetical protein